MLRVFLGLLILAAARPVGAVTCDSNLLIVLDRSCSMQESPNDAGSTSKWDHAVATIEDLTITYQGRIRFGLLLFPSPRPDGGTWSVCEMGPIPIPLGPGNESLIATLLDATKPNHPCTTPIDTAMQRAATDPGLADTERRSFVLLITDGEQSGSINDGGVQAGCGGMERNPITKQAIKDLYDAGVPTYVVGFGGAVSPAALDLFAAAGGVGNPTSPQYFQADDAPQLEAVLKTIANAIGFDPEFTCPGLPCPDGRCLEPGTNMVCSSEHICVPHIDDGGVPGTDAAVDAAVPDSTGAGPTGNDSGCGCRAAAAAPGGAGWLVPLVILRSRRRPLPGHASRRRYWFRHQH